MDECDESDEEEVIKVKVMKNDNVSRNKTNGSKSNTFIYKEISNRVGVAKSKTALNSARGTDSRIGKENVR